MKLGFEIKLTAREGNGVDVVIRTLDPAGIASDLSQGDTALRVDDDLLEINGTVLATLPAGYGALLFL